MTSNPPAGGHELSVELVAVGRVGKAHGIRGAVFVEPWTDAPEERFAPGQVLTSEAHPPLTVAERRDHSGKLVVSFEGVDTRNAAEEIRGLVLTVPASQRPPIDDPDEFYDTDLIGLRIGTQGGVELGTVTDVLHSPGGSVLAVDHEGREVLVPFRKEFVPVVDLAARTATVTLPDGLLDL